MFLLDDIYRALSNANKVKNAVSSAVPNVQAGVQQFGYNRAQGTPLMGGGGQAGTSVINALTNKLVGQAQASGGNQSSQYPMSMANQSYGLPVNTIDGRTPPPTGDGGGGGNPGGAPNPDAGPDFAEILRRAKEEGLRKMGFARDEALRYGQQARDLLGKRRGEFTDMFNEGQNNIITQTEKNRGELQRADEESGNRARNNLSTMGIGGSALERLYGRQQQARARALGGLQDTRNTNEVANKRDYNSRNDWAQSQEDAIGASERAANENYQSGANTSEINFGGSLAGLLGQIQAQQAALRAANDTVGGYSASPYALTGMDPSGLISNLQTQLGGMGLMGGNAQTPDNAGVSIPQNPQNEVWKKLMGLVR